MKRSSKVFLLLGILAVVCLATFIVKGVEEHREKVRAAEMTILDIPVDSVKSLSWQDEKNKFSFRNDGQWKYDEDEAFPVDQDKIKELLEVFEDFIASFIIEDVEDYGQYGLDNPVCTIDLSTDDKSYTITLGNFSKMDSQRYVSIGDGNVYLVKEDPFDHYEVTLDDLLDHDEPPSFKPGDVTEIRFSGKENYSIVYEKDSPDTYYAGDVYFALKDGRKFPLDTSRVENFLRKIGYLKLKDYVTYNALDTGLEKYGLDEPYLATTLNYTSKGEDGKETNETFVLKVGLDPEYRKKLEEEKDKADEEEKEEEIKAYARFGDSKIVYRLTPDDYKKLTEVSYDDLRHLEVFWADFRDVNRIDITLEGIDYTITSGGKGDKRKYYYHDEEIDIGNLKKAIQNIKADSFTNERSSKKSEIALTIHLDNENIPAVRINFYRYDGIHCLAVVDGEPVSLVKRSGVTDLIEAVFAIVLK